jgi:hypothetical protein
MDMIINGVAVIIAVSVFATFVGQVLAPLRRSALWAAPAAAPMAPRVSAPAAVLSAEIIELDDHRRPVTSTVAQPIAA